MGGREEVGGGGAGGKPKGGKSNHLDSSSTAVASVWDLNGPIQRVCQDCC